MSQFDFGNLESPVSGTTLINGNIEPWRDALHSQHSGDERPDYAVPGMQWLDTTNTNWIVYVFDGSEDIKIGTIDTTNNLFIPENVGNWAGTAGGTANALTLSPTPAITELVAGMTFDFIISATNTTASPTLEISDLDAETIKANLGAGNVGLPKGALVNGTAARVLYDGTDFILINIRPCNTAGDVATAGTINLNATTGDYVLLTGTTNVSAITLIEGQQKVLRCNDVFTLVHSSSLVIPGASDVDTTAGDIIVVRGEASGVVRVLSYTKSDGTPLIGAGGENERIHVQHRLGAGNSGGSVSNDTETKIPFNTVVENTIPGASMLSSVITLPAGTYKVIDAYTMCYRGGNLQVFLKDTTASANILDAAGDDMISYTPYHSNSDFVSQKTGICGQPSFTISVESDIEVIFLISQSSSTHGFGYGLQSDTYDNVLAEAIFEKVG